MLSIEVSTMAAPNTLKRANAFEKKNIIVSALTILSNILTEVSHLVPLNSTLNRFLNFKERHNDSHVLTSLILINF